VKVFSVVGGCAGKTVTVRRLVAWDDPLVLAVTADRPVDAPAPFLPLSEIAVLADFVLTHAITAGAAEPLATAAA
jgi:hypothetical protein